MQSESRIVRMMEKEILLFDCLIVLNLYFSRKYKLNYLILPFTKLKYLLPHQK